MHKRRLQSYSHRKMRAAAPFLFLFLTFFFARHAQAALPAFAAGAPVSYHKQIWPILQAKCQGCHQPASAGGKLVVTSYAEFSKGGEHGVTFLAGKPNASALMEYLTGKRTLMPKGGPALPAADIALFRRWIAEGAKDDSPVTKDPIDAAHPPTYSAPPVITALTYSPDGATLAVSGYRETLLHHADGSGIVGRLIGASPKIESIVYSPDGKLLAAVGGAPAVFGEIQIWDTTTNKQVKAFRTTYDTLFGASFSPDGKELSFGCADNSVRVVTIADGKEIMKLDNHSDWVFSTAFSLDGKHVLSAGRDQAIKLTLIEGASFIDDINTHTSALRCLVRNPKPLAELTQTGPRRFRLNFTRDVTSEIGGVPYVHITARAIPGTGDIAFPLIKASGASASANPMAEIELPASLPDTVYDVSVSGKMGSPADTPDAPRAVIGTLTVANMGKKLDLEADQVLCAGDDSIPRLYKVFRSEVRTMNQEDHNLIRTFERQSGVCTAAAFSADGRWVAVGSESGIANVYDVTNGKRVATLSGHKGVLYAVAFQPDGKQIVIGGFDGMIRIYDLPSGKLAKAFVPVPITKRLSDRK